MTILFDRVSAPLWPVSGCDENYPINRIFCVGRNYAAHAIEMGMNPERDPPFYFTKWGQSYVPSGTSISYPQGTGDYHYEVELVIAIGTEGQDIPVESAEDYVFGYAVGLDMTRRDLQLTAREKGRPWDLGKNFDQSAPLGPLMPVRDIGHRREGLIELKVNGEVRQTADIAQMIWDVPHIIADLSKFYRLQAGDIIMTGTPAGVGPVVVGDKLVGTVEGLGEVQVDIID